MRAFVGLDLRAGTLRIERSRSLGQEAAPN
jgi:hypothetical protein